jgi:hypothetical protein
VINSRKGVANQIRFHISPPVSFAKLPKQFTNARWFHIVFFSSTCERVETRQTGRRNTDLWRSFNREEDRLGDTVLGVTRKSNMLFGVKLVRSVDQSQDAGLEPSRPNPRAPVDSRVRELRLPSLS